MWVNLNKLKSTVTFFIDREKRLEFLLKTKRSLIWTKKKVKEEITLSKKKGRETKIILLDYQYFFYFLQQIDNKVFVVNKNFYSKQWFLIHELIVMNFTLLYFLKIKYGALLKQITLLKIKQVYFLKQKYFYIDYSFHYFDKIFLFAKYFLLFNKIILYLNLYIIHLNYFFICFFELEKYLRLNLFLDLTLDERKVCLDECDIETKGTSFYFKEQKRWIKNKDVKKKENLDFLFSIPLRPLFLAWKICEFYYDLDINTYIYVLFFKFVKYKSLIWVLNYKKNIVRKNEYIIYDFSSKLKLKNENINHFHGNNVNFRKIYLNKLPWYINRSRLFDAIFFRRYKYKNLWKRTQDYKGPKVLLNKQEDKVYFIFLNFISVYFEFNYTLGSKLLKKYELNSIFLKKKLLMILNLLFIIYHQLHFNLKLQIDNKYLKFFCYTYFFFLKRKLKITYFETFDLIKKNTIDKYKFVEVNSFLFNWLLKIIAFNYDYNIEIKYSMKYHFLNIALFNYYKYFWKILNNNLIKKVEKYENLLKLSLRDYKFFHENEVILKKLYDLYFLYYYNCWSLSDYFRMLKNQIKLLEMIVKKNKRKKIQKYFKYKKSKFLYFKKYKHLKFFLNFNLLRFLLVKLSIFRYIDWYEILKLFNYLKKNNLNIKNLFTKFIYIYWKKSKIPFFLRLNFSSKKAFSLYLSRSFYYRQHLILKKLIYSLLFFDILSYLNFNSKNNNLNFKFNYHQSICLLYLKKKILKLKKNRDSNYNYKEVFGVFALKKKIKNKNSYGKNSYMVLGIKKWEKLKKKIEFNLQKLEWFNMIKYNLFEQIKNFFREFFFTHIIIFFNNHLLYLSSINNLEWDFYIWINNELVCSSTRSKIWKINGKLLLKKKFINYIKINFFNSIKFISIFENLNLNTRSIFYEWFSISNINLNTNIHAHEEIIWESEIEIENDLLIDYHSKYYKNLDYFGSDIFSLVTLFYKLLELEMKKFEHDYLELNLKYKIRLLNNLIYVNEMKYDIFKLCCKNFFDKWIFITKKDLHFNKKLLRDKIDTNLYINNVIKKTNFINLEISAIKDLKWITTKLNSNSSLILNKTFINNKCFSCQCVILDSYTVKKIKSYQNLLNLDLKLDSIRKFEFINCKKCKFFKVLVNNEILFYQTTRKVLKYFYLKQNLHKHCFIYDNRLITLFRMYNNDLYFTESITIKLKNNKTYCNFFYFFYSIHEKNTLNRWPIPFELNLMYDLAVVVSNNLDLDDVSKDNRDYLIPMWFRRLQFNLATEEKKRKLLIKLPSKYGKKKGYKVRRDMKKQARKEFFEWFVKS